MRPGYSRPVAVIAFLLLVAGCSSLSVRHLAAKPWDQAASQELVMKFWRFEFTCVPSGERYGVKGAAYPLAANLPGWAQNLESLTLTAYLRDKNGTVLDSDTREYLPMTVDAAHGAAFDFFLDPGDGRAASGLFVSFGYRAMFTAKARTGGGTGTIPDGEIFFAEEGALIKN